MTHAQQTIKAPQGPAAARGGALATGPRGGRPLLGRHFYKIGRDWCRASGQFLLTLCVWGWIKNQKLQTKKPKFRIADSNRFPSQKYDSGALRFFKLLPQLSFMLIPKAPDGLDMD